MKGRAAPVGLPEFVPVRQLFSDEARDFTKWMEEHIDVLAERLGLELNVVQREKTVGDFNVDLMCEGADGAVVIVENQLEKTDHDHLGKLLTYLVNLDARVAVWVTAEPRPEHQRVIEWLNEHTGAEISFHLVKVEAVRIEESPAAPLFTVLVGPDRQAKKVGVEKKEWADRHVQRFEFWTGLLEKTREKTKLFANISPGRYNTIMTGAGRGGVSYQYEILMDWGGVSLYIDHDRQTGTGNKTIFDALHAEKEAIEREFGAALLWQRLDDSRACRIEYRSEQEGLASPETWPGLQDDMIDAMIRFERALRPRLSRLEA